MDFFAGWTIVAGGICYFFGDLFVLSGLLFLQETIVAGWSIVAGEGYIVVIGWCLIVREI